MTNPLKDAIRKSVERLGYVVMTKERYEGLLTPASTPVAGPAPVVAPTVAPIQPAQSPDSPREKFDFSSLPSAPAKLSGFAPSAEMLRKFEDFYPTVDGKTSLEPAKVLAIFSAVQYLNQAKIEGDIIDSGEGKFDVMFVVARALDSLGDTGRQLIVYDVSGVPRNRSLDKLDLWGGDFTLLEGRRPRPMLTAEKLPELLAESGYPLSNITVLCYPRDLIEVKRPIALLGLTAESYQSNRAAIGTLFPRLQPNGVLTVEGNETTLRPTIPGCVQHHIDAVVEYLKMRNLSLPFWKPTTEFRLTIVPKSA